VRVQVYPADYGACGFYRMRLPARLASAEGHEVSVEEDQSPRLEVYYQQRLPGTPSKDDAIVGVARPDCELIVFQRPLHWHVKAIIPFIQQHGVAVAVEIDDDFHAVEKNHVAYTFVHPRLNPVANRDHLMEACTKADWVIASTPSLARRYGGHGRVSVVRNRLDRQMFGKALDGIERTRSVGWAGNPRSHPKDLTSVGTGLLEALAANREWHALLVSDDAEGLNELQVPMGQGEVSPNISFDRYFPTLAGFGIGLTPLRLVPFNTAKSFLKGLEYAAVGTPSIASPTSEYRLARKIGLCETATTASEWWFRLNRWMTNDDERIEYGMKAQAAAQDWFAQDHLEEWLTAWRCALDRRAKVQCASS